MGWAGFNCSLPHKVAVIAHLDGLGESARIIGAVNCAVRQPDGAYLGENTDGKGFLASLRSVADPAGAHVVVFGAGGAARAVAVETALAGAEAVTVVNRTRARGQELVDLLADKTPARADLVVADGAYRVPDDASIVVNATSIGLSPDVDGRLADVIPNPPRTLLVREAAERGCVTLDGLGMLVNQGVISIRHWTGVDVDPAVMRATVAEILGV
jgi:shikimate dehydrogenase